MSNQNNSGNNGGKGNMPDGNNNNPNRMNNIPGNMHGGNMGFQPGMMNYGMPSFMSHLSMGGMPNQQMPQGMFPNGQQMMNQEGGDGKQGKQQNQDNQQNTGNNQAKDNNSNRLAKSEEPKDQSKLQGEAKNAHVEKQDNKSEGGEGKCAYKDLIVNNTDKGQEKDEKDLQNQGEALKRIEKHNQERREENNNNNDDQNEANEGEDEDGKYNLRKRSRKENPSYYY
jgi:hypothetical protein